MMDGCDGSGTSIEHLLAFGEILRVSDLSAAEVLRSEM